MGKRLEDLKANSDVIREIAGRHNALSISVFGSVAKGQDKDSSDYDFLVETKPNFSLIDQIRLRRELMEYLHADVDLVEVAGLLKRDDHIREEAIAI